MDLGEDDVAVCFINCNKCPILGGFGHNRTGLWTISVLSAQFCSQVKTALKYRLVLKLA
jgi:hypothetical protein